MSKLAISFYGGAQQVTGACYLLEVGDPSTHSTVAQGGEQGRTTGSGHVKRILIDCGLIQGGRFCEPRNAHAFPFDAKTIDALFVTHAHLDHVGRIPKLVHEGFRGPIYSTPPTKELAELLVRDGYSIMEHEARECGEMPAYGVPDIDQAMSQWKTVEYREAVHIGEVEIALRMAGHILGSAMVLIKAAGKTIAFSGDLGVQHSLLLPPPDVLENVDYLVLESTYGNKTHQSAEDRSLVVERAIEDVAARGGTLMIPAFATERTQDLIFEINEKMVKHQVPQMPVFLDAPLAIKVTEVFERYREYYNDHVKELHRAHPDLFKSKMLKATPSVEESKAINDVPPPKVIIAGSGMMTGGRILHHLKRNLPDEKSILMITGYQVPGSLGRRILDDAEEVEIMRERVPVKASIVLAQGYSGHGDRDRLFEFVKGLKGSLKRVFAVHGESEAALAFVAEVRDRLGIQADAPEMGQRIELN